MIIDAPLQLPGQCSYAIFGDTEICRRLQEILAVVRPEATFLGFRSDTNDRSADHLIVTDLSIPGAAELLGQRDLQAVAIFPVPLGDYWSYWEFSKFALERLTVNGEILVSEQNMAEIQGEMGRVVADPETGAPSLRNSSYLSMQKDQIGEGIDKILEVFEGLSDDASRENFSLLLTSPPREHWKHYVARAYANIQYFDYIDFSRCETVLNGGIFGGYELPFLVARLPVGSTVLNVDPLGHDPLTEYVRPWVDSNIVNFVEHRIALSDYDGEIEISLGVDGQVSITSNATEGIETSFFPCRTIDSLVKEICPGKLDLLKLDLEGADQMAIAGAVETLVKNRPQLALSIYHFVSDFWEIPHFIMRLLPDYDFYLEFYSFERWETILYGVPRELGHHPSQRN